jgi:hypothetical protein
MDGRVGDLTWSIRRIEDGDGLELYLWSVENQAAHEHAAGQVSDIARARRSVVQAMETLAPTTLAQHAIAAMVAAK